MTLNRVLLFLTDGTSHLASPRKEIFEPHGWDTWKVPQSSLGSVVAGLPEELSG